MVSGIGWKSIYTGKKKKKNHWPKTEYFVSELAQNILSQMSSVMNYFPVTAQGYGSGHFLSRWDTLCYPITQCRCFSFCLVQGWLSIWVFRVFSMKQLTQSRHGDCKEQTSKLHIPEGCNTRGKHSLNTEVTSNSAFWGHFNTPQENILISGMLKYFVLFENVRQNALTLPEKSLFGFFSQNFHPEKKSWHFSSLFQCGIKTNIEMSGFAAGWKFWILPNF